jgi:hypothetical protein
MDIDFAVAQDPSTSFNPDYQDKTGYMGSKSFNSGRGPTKSIPLDSQGWLGGEREWSNL